MDFRYLSEWYSAKCNGDWEHSYGITIETVDNPGWVITLRDDRIRRLYDKPESYHPLPCRLERSDSDFVIFFSRYSDETVEVLCGATNLEEALEALWEFYLNIPE